MIETTRSITYWSYKSSVQIYWLRPPFGTPQRISEHWLGDYWFGDYYIREFGLSWVIVFLFVAQIVILATGIMSVLKSERILALIPTIICPIVTVLMVYTNVSLSQWNLAADSYQPGYWLTYPSTALFIISFIIKARSH